MKNIYVVIFIVLFLASVVQGAKKKELPPLKRGPGGSGLWGEKTPRALWGTRCIDTDTKIHYWFGGAGGISKKGPLFTYYFNKDKWEEILSSDSKQLKIVAEMKTLELEMRTLYTAISNRYYLSELEVEKSIKFDEICITLVTKLTDMEKNLKRPQSLNRFSKAKKDLEVLATKLKNSVSVKEVAEARRIYRELVQVRWSSDVQPCPRYYPMMAYDSKTKKIVLFGGEGVFGVYADTWLFDTTTKTWEQVFPKSSPSPRCAHGMIANEGKAYLVGGYNARGSKSYCTGLWFRMPMNVWQYNIAKNTWILIKKNDSKPQKVQFQRRVKASISEDGKKLSWITDILSYGKKKGEIKGETAIPGQEIMDHKLSVLANTIQIRSSAFDPAFFEEKPVTEVDTNNFKIKIKSLPSNKWVWMGPPQTPSNRDWGTTILDLKRDQLLHWAGGHSSHCGTDVAHYSLKTNRWHIAYTPELPFERTYGVGYGAPSLSGRPFGVHTYLSYAIDQLTGKMLWAGAGGTGGNFKLVNPSGVYLYDTKTSEWSYAKLNFQNKEWGYMEQHLTCMVATPKGIAVWMPKLKGGNHRSGLWIANLEKNIYEPLAGTENKDKTTLPFSAYGDGHGMTYDSKRDRVLLFHFKQKEKFRIWSCNLKSKKVEVLTPKNSEKFPLAARFPREATYIPDLDIVYVPTSGRKKYQADLIYDCAKNEWLQIASTGKKDKRGRMRPGYAVSTGVEWDPKRKVLWLVQTTGAVYAMRLDLKTAGLKPVEPSVAPVKK
ncbi:MAG: hypothetical protein COA79_09565 [Planctomycetota bacterium]|nr:MAG: hypothetical protein COA79_09565 [Planctomycetota bacterium]